jgi:predicted PurR-regulated permease PerM
MSTTPATPSPATPPPAEAVPWRLRALTEWSWRLVVVGVAAAALIWVLRGVSEVTVPLAAAVLLAALMHPVNMWLRARMPRGAAAAVSVIALMLVVGVLVALVGSQVSGGLSDLTAKVSEGITQVREWLRTTFNITDLQFTDYVKQLQDTVTSSGSVSGVAAKAGLTATHFIAGTFLALFSLVFFLYDGRRITTWLVGLLPKVGRARALASADIAWDQLTAFVRATIMVAFVDAVGIGLGAAILRVPFAAAIFVIVFLGSFVPIVGALVSGAVAVLLALVAHGPVMALVMLAVVLGVQQLESHVLQPFLLGRAVRLHPLAVVLAIAVGVLMAGIVGALVAVPVIAVGNAVGRYLLADPQPVLEDVGGPAGPDPA